MSDVLQDTPPDQVIDLGQFKIELPPEATQAISGLRALVMRRKAEFADAQLQVIASQHMLDGYILGLCAERNLAGQWSVDQEAKSLTRVG